MTAVIILSEDPEQSSTSPRQHFSPFGDRSKLIHCVALFCEMYFGEWSHLDFKDEESLHLIIFFYKLPLSASADIE